MDIEDYFHGIRFTLVDMEKGYYIYEARVSSGDETILRVISKNRAEYLHQMKWKKLWGLKTEAARGRHRLQTFLPDDRHCVDKVLFQESSDYQKTVYMNRQYPYTVTLPNIDNYDNPYEDVFKMTLIEALGTPQFEVRRF